MENSKIRNKIKELNNSTQEVLQLLLSDSILEIACRHRISEDILRRIVLVYLSLFGEENYFEYDDLNLKEKMLFAGLYQKELHLYMLMKNTLRMIMQMIG